MKNIDKEILMNELTKAMNRFHEAKLSKNSDEIKYHKGFSEGIMQILLKLEVVTNDELYEIIKNVELAIPTIYRK